MLYRRKGHIQLKLTNWEFPQEEGLFMYKSLALVAAFVLAPVAIAQTTPAPTAPGGGMPSPEQVFEFMDANTDGFIAKDEAQGPLAQNFDYVDGDKDGKISLAELKTVMAAMRPPEPSPANAEKPAQSINKGGWLFASRLLLI